MNKRTRARLNSTLAAIQANWTTLQPGTSYSLEQLVGAAFWGSLTTAERRGLGISFKAHVLKHSSPVRWVGSTPTHCQLYQLP